MVIWLKEQNAETRRHRDAELIDESLIENKITDSVIAAAIEVHKTLGGPGLLESIYEDALAYLRLTHRRLGLVLNFGQSRLCDGISRIVNHL